MERALIDALSQWRVSRCEQLALNIDALHELIVRGRPQFPDDRWDEVCARRREVELPGLLSSLPPITHPLFGARLDALRAFPPDPHLPEVLRLLLEAEDDLATPARRAVWRRVLPTLAAVGDPRTRRWLPALVASQRGGTPASRAWLRAEVSAVTGVLPVGEPSPSCAPLPTVPMLSELSELEKLVTADRLSEAGDPLGEFLVLQQQAALGGLKKVQGRRMRALQVLHARRWLGPLSRALRPDGLRFERGVVVEGTLSGVRALDLAGHVGFAALRSLDLRALREVTPDRVVRFLREPVLRGLVELTGITEGVALQLTWDVLPFRLQRLHVLGWQLDPLLRTLGAARSLASLGEVDLNGVRWRRAGGEWQK